MRWLVLIIGFPLGLSIVVYREKVKRFTGDFGLAEQWLGPGGTYTALAIFGVLVSIGSLMYGLGTFQLLIENVLGPIFAPSQF